MTTSSTINAPYYQRREPPPDAYAQDYWAPKADPDGVLRDRRAERKQYLNDIAQELEFAKALSPRYVLDFGCGLGWFLLEMRQHAKHVQGVEDSDFAIDWCEQSFLSVVKPGDIFQDGPPLGGYDLIFCHHVIEHLDFPEFSLRHFHGWLAEGACLIISTPDFESPCAKRFGANYRLLHDKTHISLFSQDGLLRMLRDTGFTVDRVEYPFPERYATPENFARWNDTSKISPPWPGNFITAYCRKV